MAVPPTVRDSKKRRWPIVVFSLLFLGALVGGGIFVYLRFFSYQNTALRHVPEGTNIALRTDVKLITFKPVREHLWPVLLDVKDDLAKSDRLKRVKAETGISIPLDLREVIIASVDARSWVIIVGGTFERGRFVTGLKKVLDEEGAEGWKLDDDLLVHDFGVAIGQAEDGVLVFGTTVDITRAALPAAEQDAQLPVPTEGAISFLINNSAWNSTVNMIPLSLPGTDTLRDVEQLTGNVMLTEDPRIDVVVEPKKGVEPDELAGDIESMFSKMRLALLLVSSDLRGGKQAIREAEVETVDGKVKVTAPWPYEKIDESVEELAQLITDTTGKGKLKKSGGKK